MQRLEVRRPQHPEETKGVQSGWYTEGKLQRVGGKQEPEKKEYIYRV